MMVSQARTAFREKLAGAAAVETDRRLLQVIEPRGRRLEAIVLLERGARGSVEQPHPFVRGERERRQGEEDKSEESAHGDYLRALCSGRLRRRIVRQFWSG